VLPAHLVPAALTSTDRAVVRPRRWGDVADAVHALKAQRPILLELDALDNADRRRALDFMTGVAYGLEASIDGVADTPHVYMFEPNRAPRAPRPAPDAGGRGQHQPTPAPDLGASPSLPPGPEDEVLCVLCDLRAADMSFQSPLDMVIRRDGSRIWSPPAAVCRHCRTTIRHWRFAFAWCTECERWGRRGVTSPCGLSYGA
jgi:hypothetical protein